MIFDRLIVNYIWYILRFTVVKMKYWLYVVRIRVIRRRQEPKSTALTCEKILHRAKVQTSMCKCTKVLQLQLLGDETPEWGLAPGPHWGTSGPTAPLATLSGNESLCFSLRLHFRF